MRELDRRASPQRLDVQLNVGSTSAVIKVCGQVPRILMNKDRSRRARQHGKTHNHGFESDANPRADQDLRLLARHSTVAFTSNRDLRNVWRRAHLALNGGGYHLLKRVRGEHVAAGFVKEEYSEFCRNRVLLKQGRGGLAPYVVVPERTLLALLNSGPRLPSYGVELTAADLDLSGNRSTHGDVRVLGEDGRAFLNLLGIPSSALSDEEAVRQIAVLIEAFEADIARNDDVAATGDVPPLDDLGSLMDVDDHNGFLIVDDDERDRRRRDRRQRQLLKETEFRNRVLLTLHGQRWFDLWSKDGIVSTRWWAERAPLLDVGDGTTTLGRLRSAINVGSGGQLQAGEVVATLRSLACPGANENRGRVPLPWFQSERAFDFWRWAEAEVQSAALRALRLSRIGDSPGR